MKSILIAIALIVLAVPIVAQNHDATLVNGVDGYFDVPASPSLVPQAGITLEAWVFFNNVGLNPALLYPTIARKNVGVGQEEYYLRVQGTGALQWKIKVGGTFPLSLTVNSPTQMPGGVWTHVAGTYDGSIARLYINGVQIGQTTAFVPGPPFNGGGGLRLGKGEDQGGPSEVWSGSLDEIRIWSVARTGAQIQTTMPWQLLSAPGLVSAWQMPGSGYDAIGSNHASVVGSIAFGASSLVLSNGFPPWQWNQPEMSLDVDGTASDGFTPPILTRTLTPCSPVTATVHVSSTLAGNPWDLAITAVPGVRVGEGALVTPGGQIVNIDVLDPTLKLLFAPGSGPPVSPAFPLGFPISFTSPFSASAQALIANPLNPDGFTLSSLIEMHVVPGVLTIPGPVGDNSVVTVSLSNPALCGAPPSIPFYGVPYTQLDVSSNGRVMFGSPAPNPAFTPSVAAALTGYPFVGPWCDLAPNLAGSITVSVPSPQVLRVDWVDVRFLSVNATATFGIQFDAAIGGIQIDGLGGIPSGPNQFLGITAGLLGAATNAGPTAFVAGGPFALANISDMIYAFGPAGSLANGLTAIVFLPSPSGGYIWGAY